MILLLILLVLVAIALPVIINLIKNKFKIPEKIRPLLPLAVGIVIGIILFFFPALKMTTREGVLFGLAAGGLSAIVYDFLKGIKTVKK